MTVELDRKVDIFGLNIEGQTKLNEKWSKTEFSFKIFNNSIDKKSNYPWIYSIFKTLFRKETSFKKVKSLASFITWTPNRRAEDDLDRAIKDLDGKPD